MAYTPVPSTWLTGYTLASHVAGFKTNQGSPICFAQLTDALADPTTGDIRAIMMSAVEAFYQAWQTQGSANQPTKMTIVKAASGSGSATVFTYTFKFTVSPTSFIVASE